MLSAIVARMSCLKYALMLPALVFDAQTTYIAIVDAETIDLVQRFTLAI